MNRSNGNTGTVRLGFRRLPSVWGSYPGVMLTQRPRAEDVLAPVEVVAVAERTSLKSSALERYSRVCGFGDVASATIVFPHILAMPLHLKIFSAPQFALRPMGLIHLANSIESRVPIEPGRILHVESAARNFERTDIGIGFDVATTISADGAPLWLETCRFLSRFAAPLEGTGRPQRPQRPPRAPKTAEVLTEIDVSLRTAWDYARVSADFNPIHLSERAAKYFGMRGAIAHGMWSLARSVAVSPPSGGYPLGHRLETQFLSPVQLPARVAVKQWTEEGSLRRAVCDVRTGRIHMYSNWANPG